MKLLSLIPILLLFISGCSIRPEAKPPITQYYLKPDISLSCPPSPSQKVVRLSIIETTPYLSTQNIIYTKPDLTAGSYLYSRWNRLANRSISTALYTAFKENSVFDNLVYENRMIRSDITLEVKVLKFEHRFSDDEHSHGLVVLDAMIYDSRTRELLKNRLFRSEVKAQTNDARGGVEALNTALGKLLSDLVCWSTEEVSLY